VSNVKVRVDFNSRSHGRVRASVRRADGPVANGQTVTVFDPYEHGMAYEGVVHELDELGRFTVEVNYVVETVPMPSDAKPCATVPDRTSSS